MTVEMTPDEAQLLIAVLTHAETTTALRLLPQDEAVARVLVDLRPWRSALLRAYLSEAATKPDAVDPVDRIAELTPAHAR